MHLLLFRHGIAEDAGPGMADADRSLTDEGFKKTREAARGLAQLIDPPSLILASPKRRAHQTAEIAAEALGAPLELMPLLAEEKPRQVLAVLAKRREASLMIVGHEPTLSDMVSLGCTGEPGPGFVQMKKAGCACIDAMVPAQLASGRSTLLWLATPRMLRAIAAGA